MNLSKSRPDGEVGLRCIPAGVHRIPVGAEGILVLLVEQREQLGFDCIVLVRDQLIKDLYCRLFKSLFQ
jgi:hypothetical protein